MILQVTDLPGCLLIEPEPFEDDRGLFARTFDAAEFRIHGLDHRVAQCSISFNLKAGTLRGLHFQSAPHEEAKLVRCTRGRVFDVAVDVRPRSATFGRWAATMLDERNRHGMYIPQGLAHGFVTLEEGSELTYAISTPFVPEASRGVRWNDPDLGIPWPVEVGKMSISRRDQQWPLLSELASK